MNDFNNNSKKLIKNIWATLCYYDSLDYPLTEFEIAKFLINDSQEKNETDNHNNPNSQKLLPLLAIRKVLRKSDNFNNKIEYYKGFYFLKGRKNLVNQRIAREKISVQKIRSLRKIIFWLRIVPFTRSILVTGRLAFKNADLKSDWDVLIISQKGRIWINRTLITLFTWISGKRRTNKKSKDKVCLNYFITNETLEISLQDLFSAHEYSVAFPIFDSHNVFSRFRQFNHWIKNVKPFYFEKEKGFHYKLQDNQITYILKKGGEWILNNLMGGKKLDDWLASWQKKKIQKNPLTHLKGSLIKVSDQELIFLPQPHGPIIFEKFMRRKSSLD